MGRESLFFLNLHAIEFVREALRCKYEKALRVVQLYSVIAYQCRHGAGAFCQSAYSRKTGCNRGTILADLQDMRREGWIEFESTARGTNVRAVGIPFSDQGECRIVGGLDLDSEQDEKGLLTGQATDAYGVRNGLLTVRATAAYGASNIKKEKTKRTEQEAESGDSAASHSSSETPARRFTTKWNKAKKAEICEIWNQHKPKHFQPMDPNNLSVQRCRLVIDAMSGCGATSRFVEELPALLAYWSADEFWGSPERTGGPVTWDRIFRNARPLMEALDGAGGMSVSCKPDRPPVRFDLFGQTRPELGQFIVQRNDMTTEQILRSAVELVVQGDAPASKLADLDGWTPDLPINEPIRDKLGEL